MRLSAGARPGESPPPWRIAPRSRRCRARSAAHAGEQLRPGRPWKNPWSLIDRLSNGDRAHALNSLQGVEHSRQLGLGESSAGDVELPFAGALARADAQPDQVEAMPAEQGVQVRHGERFTRDEAECAMPRAAEEPVFQRLDRREDGEHQDGARGRGQVEAPAAASPTAATAQTLAAVVRPWTVWLRRRIKPAPRKPIPLTTWAAIREGSSTTRPGCSTSWNPYAETIITRADPTLTSMCVRRPAALSSRCRSRPIRLPSTAAVPRRKIISRGLTAIAEGSPRAPFRQPSGRSRIHPARANHLADRLAIIE